MLLAIHLVMIMVFVILGVIVFGKIEIEQKGSRM